MRSIQHPFIPFFTTSRYKVETMVELAEPEIGELGADLGSGDGRVVIAFAKKGIIMKGYELDKILRLLSEKLITQEKITNAQIYEKDFWQEDLSQYDIIACYPMPDIIDELEKKLQNELKPGSRVVLNYYPFSHWEHIKSKNNIYLYVK